MIIVKLVALAFVSFFLLLYWVKTLPGTMHGAGYKKLFRAQGHTFYLFNKSFQGPNLIDLLFVVDENRNIVGLTTRRYAYEIPRYLNVAYKLDGVKNYFEIHRFYLEDILIYKLEPEDIECLATVPTLFCSCSSYHYSKYPEHIGITHYNNKISDIMDLIKNVEITAEAEVYAY